MEMRSSNSLNSLVRAFEVDQAIRNKKFVIIRFGSEDDEECKKIDEWLAADAVAIEDKAVIYTVENNYVPELVARYKLSGPSTIIFFYNNTVVDRLSYYDIKKEISQPNKKFRQIVERVQDKINQPKLPRVQPPTVLPAWQASASTLDHDDMYEPDEYINRIRIRNDNHRYKRLMLPWYYW